MLVLCLCYIFRKSSHISFYKNNNDLDLIHFLKAFSFHFLERQQQNMKERKIIYVLHCVFLLNKLIKRKKQKLTKSEKKHHCSLSHDRTSQITVEFFVVTFFTSLILSPSGEERVRANSLSHSEPVLEQG